MRSRATKKSAQAYTGLVYSYIRFSSSQQAAGTSTTRQTDYAERWAAERGLVLDESLRMRDEGRSAYHGHHLRGAFGAFMKAVEEGKVAPGSVLIVEAWDRLSRQTPMQAFRQLCEIIEAGITVVTSANDKEWNTETLTTDEWALLEVVVDMSRAHKESKHKSERIRDAYAKKCEAWQAGARIGNGIKGLIGSPNTDPDWLRYRYQTGRFELVEPHASITRRIVELYSEGYGAQMIVRRMREEGFEFGGRFPVTRIARIVTTRALMGDKVLKSGGKEYVLEGYYGEARLMSREQWDALQHLAAQRTTQRIRDKIPGIVTGQHILWCGYCQTLMTGQNQLSEKNRTKDGTYRMGSRRLRCGRYYTLGLRCTGGESCSVVPVEHAIMTYCSDQMNLDRLLASGSAPDPRADTLSSQRAELRRIEARLADIQKRIESGDEALDTLMKAAANLERQLREQQMKVASLEREVMVNQRAKPSTAAAWAELVEGVRLLDPDARVRARKLVGDTFERIDVFARGIHADEPDVIRLRLTSRNGVVRELDINRFTGERLAENRYENTDIDARRKPARAPVTRAGR